MFKQQTTERRVKVETEKKNKNCCFFLNENVSLISVLHSKGIADKTYCRNHNKHHNYDDNVAVIAAAAAAPQPNIIISLKKQKILKKPSPSQCKLNRFVCHPQPNMLQTMQLQYEIKKNGSLINSHYL